MQTLTFVELVSSDAKLWLTDENVITGSEWAELHSLTVLSLDDVISQRLSWLKLTLVTDPSCPYNREKKGMVRVTFVGEFTSYSVFDKEFPLLEGGAISHFTNLAHQSVDESVSQPNSINQQTNQSINQSIDRSISEPVRISLSQRVSHSFKSFVGLISMWQM